MGLKLVVTGASGYVARNLRRYLAGDNRLVSISRDSIKTFHGETGVVSGDYAKRRVISEAADADALVHLVGIGRQSVRTGYDAVNVESAQNAVDLCRSARIKKIIYVSGLGASAGTPLAYFISKFKAERIVAGSGLDHTIFRPSYIVGRGDSLTRHFRRQMGNGTIEIPGSDRCVIQPVHIDDVSEVILRSVTYPGFRNRILDLVGSESVTLEQYARFLAGIHTRIKRTSMEEAYHTAIVNPRTYFGVDDLGILAGGFRGNHSRLQRISKMRFRSVTGALQSSRPS